MTDTLLTDIANGYNKLFDENEKLRQQLDMFVAREKVWSKAIDSRDEQLAECQARNISLKKECVQATISEKWLSKNYPNDSTALDTMLKQAKREAYIKGFMASAEGWNGEYGSDIESDYFKKRMAKELE